jgi:tRNA (guanine37-N1)-methyltransferase
MINIDHVIMNLPASAPEFLDSFRGWKLEKLPIIHVYCFGLKCKDDATTNEAIINRCTNALGCPIDTCNIVTVRNISPTKNMYCVSFKLPPAARKVQLVSLLRTMQVDEDRNAKKQKQV